MTSARILAVAALSLFAVSTAQAQTGTQDVSYTVEAVNVIAVNGAPSLTISSATAGSGPSAAQSAGVATYDITTNEVNRKITAQINSAMPTGLALSITLGAPTGATSAGSVALSATAADVVTGIANVSESGLAITYDLTATAAAAVQSGTRTVTLTITAGV